jgi:hypothetical protein
MKVGMVGINNFNNTLMKKTFAFLILSIALVSCYDEYIKDYQYDAVYFTYQIDVRTVVVGEGMKIMVGVGLGGVMENKIDRNVNFILDNTLITPAKLTAMKTSSETYIKNAVSAVTTLKQLPANYYTLSNSSTFIIRAGQFRGSIDIKVDSATFLADAETINASYALPFYITTADADSILEPKRSSVVGLKYENMLFGNYWHGGVALINRPGKPDTTINYFTTIPQTETKIWTLTTATPNSLTTNGYYNLTTAKKEMTLTLDGTNITVSSAPGSTNTIMPDGTSTFNRPKLLQDRKIFLKYRYTSAGNGYAYHCTDTLTFRNRFRDGVNEWQDENPSHYLK